MKATGIVRRVDDLGRIVIPKEIRRTLRIREGDPLEIYTEKDGDVIFRKYSPMGDMQDTAGRLCEAIHSTTGRIAAVADCDTIVALAGAPRRDLLEKPLVPELEKQMRDRKSYCRQPGNPERKVTAECDRFSLDAAVPILCQGDLIGSVLLLGEGNSVPEPLSGQAMIEAAACFLGKQMEP